MNQKNGSVEWKVVENEIEKSVIKGREKNDSC